jgi:hypothetical protein
LRTDLAITLDTNSSIEIIEENSSYYRYTGSKYVENNSEVSKTTKENSLQECDSDMRFDVRTSDV